MKALFVIIDVLSIIFAAGLAVAIGGGTPNFFVLTAAFLIPRQLLLWLVFETFIHRDLPWIRSLAQMAILLICLPIPIFIFSLIPGLSKLIEETNFLYYLLLPATTALISSLFQFFFKTMTWEA